MATAKSTARSTRTTRSTGRRTGRPSNAEIAQRAQSQTAHLIDVAMAAASAAVRTAMGVEAGVSGTVTTVGVPQGSQSQGSQSQTASTGSTTSQAQSQGRATRKAPGRSVDPTSKASQTRDFYAENLKSANPLTRAEFVKAAAKKFGYSQQTANTYVSNIEKVGGNKLVRRGSGAARGRSRGQSQNQSRANGNGN